MKTNFTPKNILLVCVGNTWRSKIGEDYMHQELEKRGYTNLEIRSAGVAAGLEGRQFTKKIGEKADWIIAMDEYIQLSLINSFNQPKDKITSLHILDAEDNDLDELVRNLDKQLLPLIERYFPKR